MLISKNFKSSMDLLDDSWDFPAKKENITFPTDALALSCAWHRLRKESTIINPSYRIGSITDVRLVEMLTKEDYASATKVREFYSKKLMLMVLQGKPFTKFRTDLNTFVHGNGLDVSTDFLPLIATLPSFYEYDISFKDIADHLSSMRSAKNAMPYVSSKTYRSLTPIKALSRKRSVDYWLHDSDYVLHQISVEKANTLFSVWDMVFHNVGKIDIMTKLTARQLDDISFYQCEKWQLN